MKRSSRSAIRFFRTTNQGTMAHEFDSKKYEQASAHQKEWGAKLIAELDLKGNESVLDLGCGDGVLTTKIAKQLPAGRVLGIDAFP
jgi:ubiquinone/menaquinone biosynthesis C-methylase UbiE